MTYNRRNTHRVRHHHHTHLCSGVKLVSVGASDMRTCVSFTTGLTCCVRSVDRTRSLVNDSCAGMALGVHSMPKKDTCSGCEKGELACVYTS